MSLYVTIDMICQCVRFEVVYYYYFDIFTNNAESSSKTDEIVVNRTGYYISRASRASADTKEHEKNRKKKKTPSVTCPAIATRCREKVHTYSYYASFLVIQHLLPNVITSLALIMIMKMNRDYLNQL